VSRLVATFLSALFFVAVPGFVAGVGPVLVADGAHQSTKTPAPAAAAGVIAIVVGAAGLVWAFAQFVVEGRGTPSPTAPTDALVVRGLYRWVRNPMYVAVLLVIAGQALVHWQTAVAVYGVVAASAMVAFVRLYEEPTLAREYGEAYDAYRRAVPGWIPRPPATGQRRRRGPPPVTGAASER
jgi:protein-S-isoprenylcysteine O-methyltransferase Ste14